MKVKKYVGDSEYEIMNRLKQELGSDAIILNTKLVRQKGIFRYFKKPQVEITAAYEEKILKKQDDVSSNNINNINKINNELIDLKNMVKQLSTDVSSKPEIHPKLNEYWARLVKNGVNELIATEILKNIENQINIDSKDNFNIRKIVELALTEYIGKPNPLSLEKGRQNVVFFVGPTGVGKTTSLAKIASQLVMNNEYDIGFVTCDTYRIAAVEQLKIYSDILKLPLEIVYGEEDMYKALTKYKEKDVIFVDTTGMNHRNVSENDEVFNIIRSLNNSVVYLVLSGTTDYATLKSIIENYSFIEDYSIIFTKIDETEQLGNILNVRFLTDKPISYITTGQSVPDDIEILNQSKIVSYLLGEINYERSGGKTKTNNEFQ